MRKRVTALLLTLVLLVSLLPMPAAAVSTSERAKIRSAVEKVVKNYAKKVYQADSADDAFSDFFYHGFFGNGRKMVLKESDPMVAALFNAGVMQEALTEGITQAIVSMRDLNEEAFFLRRGPGWHSYYYTYVFSGYCGDRMHSNNSLGEVISNKSVHGTVAYSGPVNANDEVMELLVGTLNSEIIVRRNGTNDGGVKYSVNIKLQDHFNFSGDYSEIADKGYNTTTDDRLNNLGFLLTFVGLDEFVWSYEVDLSLELSESCAHSDGDSYRWLYNSDSMELVSDKSEGFKFNPVTKIEVIDAENEQTRYQFQLEQTVILAHNRPWVVEYDLQPVLRLSLSALPVSNTCYPYILQHDTTHLWIPYYELTKLPTFEDNEDTTTTYQWHYMGVEMNRKFTYSKNRIYSFRIENRIATDGANMLWVTVWDDRGEVVFGPEPLNDYWTSNSTDPTRVLTAENVDMLSGQDIIINYIGSKSNPIRHTYVDLRIWENGKGENNYSEYRAPTCTEQGGYARKCHHCGYVYFTDPETALGHDYGEYTYDNNASCVADGTKTAVCSRCGDKDTVTVPNTALGHSYGEYVFDNNAGCVTDGTETATCSVCGDKTTRTVAGTAKGHNHISVTVKPTCTEVGYRNHLCRCGDEYRTDEVPALGHTPVTDAAVAATCITKGLTEGSHCEVCDAVIVAQQETATVGHTWDKGTITMQPTPDRGGTIMYTCVHCGVKDYFSVQYTEKVQFEDVSDDDYFADAVAWAAEQSITTGVGEGLFGPNKGCTRGQVVTFLWRAAGEPKPTATENPFEDVRENDFFYTAVLWAVENGITTGAGEGRFDPDSTCTRGQIVTFLWRTFGKEAAEIENPFTDVENSAFYRDAVLWCVEGGITIGVSAESFAPDATCTRGQVVTFLYRAYQ